MARAPIPALEEGAELPRGACSTPPWPPGLAEAAPPWPPAEAAAPCLAMGRCQALPSRGGAPGSGRRRSLRAAEDHGRRDAGPPSSMDGGERGVVGRGGWMEGGWTPRQGSVKLECRRDWPRTELERGMAGAPGRGAPLRDAGGGPPPGDRRAAASSAAAPRGRPRRAAASSAAAPRGRPRRAVHREGGRRREQEGAARRREGAGEGAACRRGEQGRRTRERAWRERGRRQG